MLTQWYVPLYTYLRLLGERENTFLQVSVAL